MGRSGRFSTSAGCDFFVNQAASRRETTLLPYLFKINQSPLSFEEQEVLEAGKRDHIVRGVNQPIPSIFLE